MLRDLLLLLIVISGGAYGFWLMKGVDRFLERSRRDRTDENSEKQQKCAVIFSSREEPELEKWFSNAGFRVLSVTEIHLQKGWEDAGYLVALSDSDVDNLSICNLMKRTCPQSAIYSLCNDRSLKKLYRKTGASVVYDRDELIQRMELITLEHEVGAA